MRSEPASKFTTPTFGVTISSTVVSSTFLNPTLIAKLLLYSTSSVVKIVGELSQKSEQYPTELLLLLKEVHGLLKIISVVIVITPFSSI